MMHSLFIAISTFLCTLGLSQATSEGVTCGTGFATCHYGENLDLYGPELLNNDEHPNKVKEVGLEAFCLMKSRVLDCELEVLHSDYCREERRDYFRQQMELEEKIHGFVCDDHYNEMNEEIDCFFSKKLFDKRNDCYEAYMWGDERHCNDQLYKQCYISAVHSTDSCGPTARQQLAGPMAEFELSQYEQWGICSDDRVKSKEFMMARYWF